jgi:hypothetical protein
MKKLLLLSAVIARFSSAQAQLNIGPEIGFNSATIKGASDEFTSRLGPRIGISADVQLSGDLYLQPGLFYSSKGGNSTTESTQNPLGDLAGLSSLLGGTGGTNPLGGLGSLTNLAEINVTSNTSYSINYLHLPILAVYKIKSGNSGKILVGVGPYASIMMNGRYRRSAVTSIMGANITTNEDRAIVNDTEISSFDFGFNGNLGYEHNSGFFCRAFYEMGLIDNTIGNNAGFGISLGYYFRGANAAN